MKNQLMASSRTLLIQFWRILTTVVMMMNSVKLPVALVLLFKHATFEPARLTFDPNIPKFGVNISEKFKIAKIL